MYNTMIQRITAGAINKVNDAVIGMPAAPLGLGVSKFAGQLGNGIYFDDSNILFDSTMGTVYGGHFRYVRLAAAATAPNTVGQLVFWDTVANAADNLYQVTTAENGTTDLAMNCAGIVLNSGWTPGNYSFIQDFGPTFVKFRGTLTAAGAIGSRVFCAAVGAGVDLGEADVIDSANPALFSDVSKMMGRYIGVAIDAPTNNGLKRVYVNFHNLRG